MREHAEFVVEDGVGGYGEGFEVVPGHPDDDGVAGCDCAF